MNDVRLLLWPRVRGLHNRWARGTRGERLLWGFFVALGAAFWVGVFALMIWLVGAFYQVEVFGPIIARKLLELLLLGLFGLLCFSNVVTSLSTYYLSDDLELVLSLPVERSRFHIARMLDTMAQTSWMAIVFGLPVFVAYGMAHSAGWSYYGLLCLVLPAFATIPAAVGVFTASVLVNVFPARRIREALVLVGILTMVFVFVLLRLVRPERLADARSFESLAAYFAELQAPVPLLTPPRWASDVLVASLMSKPFPWLELGLLLTGAVASFGVARWVTDRLYDGGRARAQEARVARLAKAGWLDRALRIYTAPLPPVARALVAKDVKTFFRDPSQWSQLFLVGSIVAIALASVWAMPVDTFKGPMLGMFRSALAFMVLGLVGFVLSALAARFQFSAISAEGKAFWLVRVSPLDPLTLLRSKLWPTLPLMIVVGQLLAVVSTLILGAGWFLVAVGSGTALLLALGLSGLAVGMGAFYPDFKADSAARAAAGPAGMLFMVVAVTLVGIVVGLEAYPVFLVLYADSVDRALTPSEIGACAGLLGVAATVCLTAATWPMRAGARALWDRELPNG